jgi:CHAT domain-containing protein
MNQNKKAEPFLTEANKIEIKNLLTIFTTLSEKEKGNYLTNNIALNNSNNSFLYNYRYASPGFYKDNYNLQLLLKSLSLADTKNALEAVRNSKDTGIYKLFDQWQNDKIILSKQYSLPIAKRRADLKELEANIENLEKELNRKSAGFRSQQNALRISMADVQKKLGEDEVAIEFVQFDLYNKKWTDSTMYAAYILHKNDSIPIFVPLCEEKQLQQLFDSAGRTSARMVKNFYRVIDVKNEPNLGNKLYQLVWQPLAQYLKGAKKISYSPAGKLYSIAFHALPVDSTTVLMDKYQLQQYTSTRQIALRTAVNQTTKPTGINLFGNASFTMDSLQLVKQKRNNSEKENVSTSIYIPQNQGNVRVQWVDLPGTAAEVNKIKQLFDENKINTTSFVQALASEENLKALNGSSAQILHIATHGFFLPEADKKKKERGIGLGSTYTLADDPLLRSGLMLAGCNYAWGGKTPVAGVEDGIATAYEISQLNLSNTELVVLSACETALGDVKGSEGVFGLQRAFKMAGVKKMIVSLWKIPDKETEELMTTFYNYWLKGKTIDAAFAQAQTDMRKKYPPYYWAAFVLIE